MIEERGFSNIFKPPVNIYVVAGSNGIIFDAGYGNSAALNQFSRAYQSIADICSERGDDNSISRILISHAHPDHFAGLKGLSSLYNLKIIVTSRMAQLIKNGQSYRDSFAYSEPGVKSPGAFRSIIKKIFNWINYRLYARFWGIEFISRPDVIIDNNCSININGTMWRIFHSPGHSDDHITLYNPSTGILFGGDNILRSKFTWLGPPRSDIDTYIESLKFIMNLPGLRLILPAHGSVISEPSGRIREIISYWENRVAQVREFISVSGDKGLPPADIISKLYPGSGRIKREFVRGWVLLLLEKFVREGEVSMKNGRYFTVLR